LRVYDVGRVEDLLLEIVKARAGKCPEGRVWEVLERLTEEVLLLWAERDRDPIFDRFRDFH
jgi:hypothetical protein